MCTTAKYTTWWRKAAALTFSLNDPLPRFLSPHFCLLLFQGGGAFVRWEQGDLTKRGGGGACHNKQKQRSNPPKSNQEPLIHALNRDWVPWERLIQSGHRQPHMGLQKFRCFFFFLFPLTVLFSPLDSALSAQRSSSRLKVFTAIFFFLIWRTHLWASINDILYVDEQSVPFTPVTLHCQSIRAPRCFSFSKKDASTEQLKTR